MVDRNTRFDRSESVILSASYVISINTFGKRSSVDTLLGKGVIPVIVFYWTNRRFFVDVAEQLDVIATRHSDNDALLLSEISDNKRLSFPNCRNIAQNFRKSFRKSASACRFVMVRAEYLSPGNNLCPYPTYGWCFSECQPSKYFVHRTALSNGGSR